MPEVVLIMDNMSKAIKHYYTTGNLFSRNNNHVPAEFRNKIICGDSEIILKQLPDNCIDVIITSPPYNFSKNYATHNDRVDWIEYFDKLFRIFNECIRILKYGGRIVVIIEPHFSDNVPTHHFISSFFTSNKMIWRNEIMWEKNNYNCKITAWGSWKSPSNPYLKYTWEYIEVFSKGSLKHNGNNKNADITEEQFKNWVNARWVITPEKNMKKFDHPAMFPEDLVTRVVKLFSFEKDFVLDPFNGVGTTTKIARQFNRRYIGIDISKEYTVKAIARLKDVLIQKSLDQFIN